jgi:hypothetical protein
MLWRGPYGWNFPAQFIISHLCSSQFQSFQTFHHFAPFKALRRFKVQGSRVQGDLEAGFNSSSRSKRSTAALRSKRFRLSQVPSVLKFQASRQFKVQKFNVQ